MYVAVKGGEAAIAASLRLLDEQRRGPAEIRELEVAQLQAQMGLAVSRVMGEGSLFDPELAALALKQAQGDALEAVFLLRAYRSTLPRLGYTEPLDTAAMRCERRISSVFKDLPGGQLLGASFDYSQRLLEFGLLQTGAPAEILPAPAEPTQPEPMPHALLALGEAGLIEQEQPPEGDPEPFDITRDPPLYPLSRAARLQMLARGDEGWVLGLAYSTQRGYANTHPFAGEIRHGHATVSLVPDELGFPIEIGEVALTECQMVNQFVGSDGQPPQFTRGYGLVLGHAERKAMAMSLVDRALRADEFSEPLTSPAQQQEFALAHSDNVEASGFVQHLKLPHYVTFESELQMLRAIRADRATPPETQP
ncbi:MAG: carbon-phosphorus lyase complex subunit PhnI [Inhella sp.]|jgi:alpha-D-ribose 1-methylphosphonate 5-triphosphate synthase subunit PhnI|uniref:carbon-phosphorus lyase complex subunit PhnI n=1 Tax=Inhella sp. TaxID=1921806 RepID=UPI0022C24F4A|nr:carbon-phosphorus lyase complex subunit PhnI [Inhella sp.]MCZ8234286.1 carbon-phosphorus lyase complex subunit PhnI [Inhella sp.]